MRTQANKISDNGNLDIYNDKNIRKLLTFDRDTTTISIEGNESKPRPTGQKNGPSVTKPLNGRYSIFASKHQITPPSTENRSHSRQRDGRTIFSAISKQSIKSGCLETWEGLKTL